MSENLLTPILRSGTRSTNFFNGRVLTAEDMQVEQAANRAILWRLGQAVGEGVISGLQVQIDQPGGAEPSLFVSPGSALNRLGQVLTLPQDQESVKLVLTKPKSTQTLGRSVFYVCPPPLDNTFSTGSGVYVLVISPAEGYAESAPKVGLRSSGVADECDSRYIVEGVQFRLVHAVLDDTSMINDFDQAAAASKPAARSRLRSHLAHLFLGTSETNQQRAGLAGMLGLLGAPPEYGPLDRLRLAQCSASASNCIMDCDVPLALLYWNSGGIQFVDMAAVRRSLHLLPESFRQPLPAHDRRLAEGEAAYLQFQTQLQEILANPQLYGAASAVRAKQAFRYLPAAGFLLTGSGQFQPSTFFAELNPLPMTLDAAFLNAVLVESFLVDPIDLTAPPQIRAAVIEGAPGLLFFIRSEVRAQEPAQPTTPGGQPGTTPGQPGSGNFTVQLIAAQEAVQSLSAEAPRRLTPGELLDTVVVTAINAATKKSYPGKYITKGSKRLLNTFTAGEPLREREETFFIGGVPAGNYTVTASVPGFQKAQTIKTIAAGQTINVSFRLVPVKQSGGKRPPNEGKGGFIPKGEIDKMLFVDKYARWPWPPPEEKKKFEEIVNPPDEVIRWAQDWGRQIQETLVNAPVDLGDIKIVVDSDYRVDQIAETPYAYILFGESGAYAPLLLTPVHETLDRNVSIGKAGVAGIDQDMAFEIREMTGITSVDVLGAAWSGLLEDTFRVDSSAAKGMISDTRSRVDQIQGSLEVFSGVSSDLAAELNKAGITNAVELANMKAADLTANTDLAKAGITQAFAQRLVSEARSVAPASTWSLTALEIGFRESEVDRLRDMGIETQGHLKVAAAAQAGTIAGTLNMSTDMVNTIVNKIDLAAAGKTFTTSRIEAAPLTQLSGANAETSRILADAGLRTVGDLANVADPHAIAGSVNVSTEKLTQLVSSAKTRLGRTAIQ
jgi:hypothetical protein